MKKKREASPKGLYHIILRGINRSNIFFCEEDKAVFETKLFSFCERLELKLLSYVLMDNHVHIELNTLHSNFSCSDLVQRLCISYVQHYFNPKYFRCGSLFQANFNSRAINDSADAINVAAYIHQNPFKAGLSHGCLSQAYSSYRLVLDAFDGRCAVKAIDIDSIRKLFKKKNTFMRLMEKNDKFNLCTEDYPFIDEQISAYIMECLGGDNCYILNRLEELTVKSVLKKLNSLGVSLKRLERITHVPKPKLLELIG